jgi:hypothetical protein
LVKAWLGESGLVNDQIEAGLTWLVDVEPAVTRALANIPPP